MDDGVAPIRTLPSWPTFLWHPKVHRDRAGETLCFYRLVFRPLFDRDLAEAGIRAACGVHRVHAVCSYELLGFHDVLCRVWLPPDVSARDFRDQLRQQLDSAGIASIEPLEVGYEMRHFAFRTANGAPIEPDSEAIHDYSDDELAEVEAYFAESLDGDLPELASECASRGLIADFRPFMGEDPPRVKFMIAVRGSELLSREPVRKLGHELAVALKGASEIRQLSLYKGSGFAHYLVMGNIDGAAFHTLHSDLLAPINSVANRQEFGVRTETHVSAQRGLQIAEEGLSIFERGRDVWLADPPRAEDLSPGRPIAAIDEHDAVGGRYVPREQVGTGGSSQVFRARDILERVDRALKLFKTDYADSAMREANALRNYDHPGLVKYIEIGSHKDRYYIVMEYVEGKTLRHLMTEERDVLDVTTCVKIMTKVLEALEYVHPNQERIDELERLGRADELTEAEMDELLGLRDWGMIHRDVKPENIMLNRDNEVKLLDFNIASPARSETHTHSGTIGYLALDAGLGGWLPTDDVFGCGVVLYELLSGAHPYVDDSGHAGVIPLDIRERVNLDDEVLERCVMRSCAPYRDDRYQTAREMLTDLAKVNLAR